MNQAHSLPWALAAIVALAVGCNGADENSATADAPNAASTDFENSSRDSTELPEVHSAANASDTKEPAELAAQASEGVPNVAPAPGTRQGFRGKVLETMTTGQYTYILVDKSGESVWVAAPKFEVAKGDVVDVPVGMAMKDFRSRSLDRTFDMIYFVAAVSAPGNPIAAGKNSAPLPTGHPPLPGAEPAKPPLPTGHPPLPGAEPAKPPLPAGHPPVPASGDQTAKKLVDPAQIDLSDVKKAEGGVTVEEIFVGKADLAGKSVEFRGKVFKFNANILGSNWLHVRDGSGASGTNDIVVTTKQVVRVGDTVLIKGVVAIDRDFGAGYKYRVLIENATATVE